MTPERYKEIGHICRAALELDSARREAYLAEACGGDEALRQEVESLLGYDGMSDSFIESPALQILARDLNDEILSVARPQAPSVPMRFNSYQLLALLGRGGMGEVHLALDTRLNRKVAIKLLPSEFTAQPERVRRFAREARAASSLNHPNIITIHEIGEVESTHYIVTEYVEGQTLRQRLADAPQGRLSLTEAIEVTTQIAAALVAAHEAGITHRDIKPENVMVRRDGYVKVLDFGLAKLTEATPSPVVDSQAVMPAGYSTEAGLVLGTPRYMSPEQARGQKVDGRTDIFSLGVTLYEMVAGRAPFAGATSGELIAAILRDAPPPLTEQAPDAPPELERIISRALTKDRNERYSSSAMEAARQLHADLKAFQQRWAVQAELVRAGQPATHATDDAATQAIPTNPQAVANSTTHMLRGEIKRHKRVVAVAVAALLLVAAGFYVWRSTNLRWARNQIPQVEALVQARQLFEAHDLAATVRKYLPQDATLARLAPLMTADLTIVSDPPGAQVYLKRFAPDAAGNFPARQWIGTTPIEHLPVALGGYLLTLEKAGYDRLERTIIGAPVYPGLAPRPFRYEEKLMASGRVPDRMAFVPGGEYRLTSWNRPTDERVRLDDFLIDKFEVTNREFKEFITAGGYTKREYWQQAFVKDGKSLTWEEARRLFVDRAGLPGPRGWLGQEFPAGRAEHPVTGITWYEASAYAAFRGKQLPTIFQWERAARGTRLPLGAGLLMPWGLSAGTISQRANFSSAGTAPVDSLEFGMSPYGCHHMAGNVTEWMRNEVAGGFVTGGGSWGDPPYLFGAYGATPGFFSSDRLGFRCARALPEKKGADGGGPLKAAIAAPKFAPVGDAEFAALLNRYRYEPTPLDPRVIEVTETEAWRREKITLAGTEDDRVIAYLYLPKRFARPLQVIHFIPPASVPTRSESLPHAIEMRAGAFIKAGRAIFAVVLPGYPERDRPGGYTPPARTEAEYGDQTISGITELRRGLDYLATRDDIDRTRIIYFSESTGDEKLILPAVEQRYRAIVMTGAGLDGYNLTDVAVANPIHFVTRIGAPTLILNGRYDESTPLKSSAEPLYQLLRAPKRLVVYEGGHVPSLEIKVPVVNGWLDELLGPVKHD